MTKTQKKISKKLKSIDTQMAFVELVRVQQAYLGGYEAWEQAHSDRYAIKN
jgi:hypothetical protein